jgi:hypothetical protein
MCTFQALGEASSPLSQSVDTGHLQIVYDPEIIILVIR